MACKLTLVTSPPPCDFTGKAGDQVTLTVKGTTGLAFFEDAQYDGVTIPGLPAAEMTFALKAGVVPLDIAYVFSLGTAGRGELHEKCENNTMLDNWVRGDNAVERYYICCPQGGQ